MTNPEFEMSKQWVIGELEQKDVTAAVDLLALCFGENNRESAVGDVNASFIAEYPLRPKTFVTKVDGAIVGIVQSITGYVHPNFQGFAWLGTHPNFRGQGVARGILKHAEDFTVATKFGDSDGTFFLVAAYDATYYELLGYHRGGNTHDNFPFMFKHHRGQNAKGAAAPIQLQ